MYDNADQFGAGVLAKKLRTTPQRNTKVRLQILSMTIADEIKHYLASKVIVKEKVDGETADARFDVCLKCEYRNPEENKCIICTCFLDLKTQSRVNWRPAKNRNEITHCPKGKWDDKEIANHYRVMDGLKLLT